MKCTTDIPMQMKPHRSGYLYTHHFRRHRIPAKRRGGSARRMRHIAGNRLHAGGSKEGQERCRRARPLYRHRRTNGRRGVRRASHMELGKARGDLSIALCTKQTWPSERQCTANPKLVCVYCTRLSLRRWWHRCLQLRLGNAPFPAGGARRAVR